jgi:hypothetical protein
MSDGLVIPRLPMLVAALRLPAARSVDQVAPPLHFAAFAARVRVSDRDRELAARRLSDAASMGVLGVTELGWRLERVL